jgi:ribosome-binding protein aMBF1 (putative translation factor)
MGIQSIPFRIKNLPLRSVIGQLIRLKVLCDHKTNENSDRNEALTLARSSTDIGKQISCARIERNLSRRDLGVILGITPEQVEKYETGMEAMRAGMLYRLSQVFELPVTAFFRMPAEGRSGESG